MWFARDEVAAALKCSPSNTYDGTRFPLDCKLSPVVTLEPCHGRNCTFEVE